jgi:hypothetical protein
MRVSGTGCPACCGRLPRTVTGGGYLLRVLHTDISNAIRASHEEVGIIVADAFAEAPGEIEVHVKARHPKISWRAVCGEPGCLPANWRGPDGAGHWYTRRKDIVRVAAAGAHGPVERVVSPAGFSGRTYDGVPGVARVRPGVRYLVTLHMPADPGRQAGPYPAVRRYPGLATAPPIAVRCWREELFALAAHEAHHVAQFAFGLRVSEIDAEHAAAEALAGWR